MIRGSGDVRLVFSRFGDAGVAGQLLGADFVDLRGFENSGRSDTRVTRCSIIVQFANRGQKMRQVLYVLIGILLVPTVGLVGDIVTDGQFKSTLERGQPPLEVASPDMVVNLNADQVDGLDASAFALTSDTYSKTEVEALIAAASAADSRRAFYVTTTVHDGDEASGACDSGFHMASIWEILDPSNLRYDTGRGITRSDSGSGAPQSVVGWIRTGNTASTSNTPGIGNCDGWSDDSSGSSGTYALLPDPGSLSWGATAIRISPWTAVAWFCSEELQVWCVED
jgi:hypothetical protein